jgi:N-acetylneuraminate lyase
MEKYADDLVLREVTGIFVNGTSAQSLSLTTQERERLLDAWLKTAAVRSKKLIVIAHIACSSIKDTLYLAKHAAGQQLVAGIAVMAPSYFRPQGTKECAELIITVAQANPKTPVYYYHIPYMTGVPADVCETLKLARHYAPNAVGCKFTDSNFCDMARCSTEGFDCLVGADDMFSFALRAGAVGSIGVSYNFTGRLYSEIYREYTNGNSGLADDLQKIGAELWNKIKATGNKIGSCYYLTQKLTGVNFGQLRYPNSNISAEIQHDLDIYLERMGYEL